MAIKTKKSVEELVERICDDEGKELMMFEGLLGEYYAAIKDKDEVYAVVIKAEQFDSDYKLLFWHENKLPSYHNASLEFVSLLTPTIDRNANIWRKITIEKKRGV